MTQYVHPDLDFMDVLNEVLPQLASKGIWKDLTFEETLQLERTDRFFTLPEEADAVLHSMASSIPIPVRPLWNAFINTGNATGRMGHYYGIEDAGFVPTKEILSNEFYYVLYVFPNYRWGVFDDKSNRYTDTAFAGNEQITIVYENWEGIVTEVTDTLSAVTTAQLLSPRAVRNIRSISYAGFETVPALIVAVPIPHYGLLTASGGIMSIAQIAELDSDYTDLGTAPQDIDIYSILNDTTAIDVNDINVDSIAATTITDSTYAGANTVSHPIIILQDSHATDVITQDEEAEDAKKIAILNGTGIVRYRLFRIHDAGNTLHILYRRKIPRYVQSDEMVYIDNLSALKYAILANTAEYNNDIVQAKAWWEEAKRELDDELQREMGAAQPQPAFDPSGGQGSIENIQ